MISVDTSVCKQHLSHCFLILFFVGILVIFELLNVPAVALISGLYEIHVNFKHIWSRVKCVS